MRCSRFLLDLFDEIIIFHILLHVVLLQYSLSLTPLHPKMINQKGFPDFSRRAPYPSILFTLQRSQKSSDNADNTFGFRSFWIIIFFVLKNFDWDGRKCVRKSFESGYLKNRKEPSSHQSSNLLIFSFEIKKQLFVEKKKLVEWVCTIWTTSCHYPKGNSLQQIPTCQNLK